MPLQDLLNVMALLGKKSGGPRTIAIMASFYRALMKHFVPAIREWDLAKGHFYDSALAGSSSLRAAVLRTLRVENGCMRSAFVGHLPWDMAKFYDKVRLPVLCEELKKSSYPPEIMVLGFFVHSAPKILKVGTCFGPVVHSCSSSILAGFQQSVSWARGLLWELMDKFPWCTLNTPAPRTSTTCRTYSLPKARANSSQSC